MIEEGIPGKMGERSKIGGSGGHRKGKGKQAARLHDRAGHQAGRGQLTALEDPDVQCRADQNCPRAPSVTGSETECGALAEGVCLSKATVVGAGSGTQEARQAT